MSISAGAAGACGSLLGEQYAAHPGSAGSCLTVRIGNGVILCSGLAGSLTIESRAARAVDNVVNLHQVFDVFFAVARNATLLRAISPNATQGQFYLDTARPPAALQGGCHGWRLAPPWTESALT